MVRVTYILSHSLVDPSHLPLSLLHSTCPHSIHLIKWMDSAHVDSTRRNYWMKEMATRRFNQAVGISAWPTKIYQLHFTEPIYDQISIPVFRFHLAPTSHDMPHKKRLDSHKKGTGFLVLVQMNRALESWRVGFTQQIISDFFETRLNGKFFIMQSPDLGNHPEMGASSGKLGKN